MPKRSSKREDANQTAHRTLMEAIGEKAKTPAVPPAQEPDPTKNPAAVALSKLGASKGGNSRAKALSKKERSKIAKNAANARWNVRK